jgi:undecaprenyl-diphosphatase
MNVMDYLVNLDRWLFGLINIKMTNPYLDVFFPAITDLHRTDTFRILFVPLICILWTYLYRLRGFLVFVFLVATLGISDKVGSLFKHFIQRPRPFDTGMEVIQRSAAGGFSFPSNHAINMFCMAFFLSTFFPNSRFLVFTMAVLVAFSRIYNGVHYPSDVVGGAVIGAVFGILGSHVAQQIITWTQKALQKRRKPKHG